MKQKAFFVGVYLLSNIIVAFVVRSLYSNTKGKHRSPLRY